MIRTRFSQLMLLLGASALLGLTAGDVFGQNGRPTPEGPNSSATDDQQDATPPPAIKPGNGIVGRRAPEPGEVILAFDDVGIMDTIPFIVEATGKVVIPLNVITLKNKKITVVNDEPIGRAAALDLLFQAFNLNGVGIVEMSDMIIIDEIQNIGSVSNIPVIPAAEDLSAWESKGTIIIKIFKLNSANADTVHATLDEIVPDSATLTVDENSNQIVVLGDVALCQHIQKMINELDKTHIKVKTETFRLAHADASEIAENILDLFEETGTNRTSARPTANRGGNTRRPTTGRTTNTSNSNASVGPGPTAELRVTVNVLQNSVTVQADPAVVVDIGKLIAAEWDLPRPADTSRVYQLEHTDPIKMRDTLSQVLGGGSSSSAGGAGARGRTGGAQASNVSDLIGNIYTFEAVPDSNSLVVIAKTKESLDFLDELIDRLDKPQTVGLPEVIELKHANAVELAQELNVLLSEAGSGVTLDAPATGLADVEVGGDGAGGGDFGSGRADDSGNQINFPWQRGRARDDQSPESPLIGKVRIVPIVRQNALAILAPLEYRQSMRELIHYFDRPGRQVMIVAIIAEVELNDDFSMGIRVSSSDLSLQNIDNSVGGSISTTGTEDNILGSLFDSSVLDVGFTANMAVQALAQQTNVHILQEPRVFTGDNQQAIFFDGQDVPFITNSNTTDNGGITQSFDYRQVGVLLNVRPRITAEYHVDMDINLELSSIVPGQTLFGGFIVDRRETSTKIIVKNGQTILLSGILRDQESEIVRKVPLLGNLPIIGGLFRSRESQNITTELIAFITPIVVDNPSDNDINFNKEYRERLPHLINGEDDVNSADLENRILDLKEEENSARLGESNSEEDDEHRP